MEEKKIENYVRRRIYRSSLIRENRRWYSVFLFDAEKDPPAMLPHEAKKICSLDLGVTEPVVVYDFDGAIITGLLAPKEVWKERLKKLAKFQSYIARLSWARENEKRRKRFEYLFSIARGPFAGWKLGQKYVFENKNGKVVYMKKTPRQFAKWKRQLEKRYAGECAKFSRWVRHQHRTAAAFLANNYDASLRQRSTFTSSTSAFPLAVEERRTRIASLNRIRCALLSIVFATPF